MISGLAFAAPWLLLGLLGLPVLWWLLRIMPPQPARTLFPPLMFLAQLRSKEETPHHTPLWLLILRLALAALIIIGLAGPVLNPPPRLTGSGPLVLVIDNGWGSASSWSRRQDILIQTIRQAERDKRPLAILTTATPDVRTEHLSLLTAEETIAKLRELDPLPWAPDRGGLARRLEGSWPSVLGSGTDFVWLSDGLETAKDEGTRALADLLSTHGTLWHLTRDRLGDPLALFPPHRNGDVFETRLIRAGDDGERRGTIRAIDGNGRAVASGGYVFADGKTETVASVRLPLELQNTISRIEITGERSAAAVSLLDERWQRRSVGIVTAGTGDIDRPLLSDVFYIDRALSPFAEVRRDTIEELLRQPPSALILPDIGQIPETQLSAVRAFVEKGGLLIRFAGPRIAERQDELVPVPLRHGGRALGGALSWEEPQHLAPFEDRSPFFGLEISDDVTVSRQVLAEPSIDLPGHTWARLTDGTPLVTADARGNGWTVLFHVTGNPDWSTLPLSGLFVDMLRRTIAWSGASVPPPADDAESGDVQLFPDLVMNGFGELAPQRGIRQPVALQALEHGIPGPAMPPGLYRRPGLAHAFNLVGPGFDMTPLALPRTAEPLHLGGDLAIDFRPWLLTLALILLIADGAIVWALGQDRRILKRFLPGAAALPILAVLALVPFDRAEADDAAALRATLKTHLAYIITGDAETDRFSERGLAGLSDVIGARTAVEPGEPIGVDPETDELAFFPLIYYPVAAEQSNLSPEAIARLSHFMRTGGTILFDTRDQPTRVGGGAVLTPNARRLRDLLTALDVPPLVRVPDDHVLTKSFYLLREFPGRWQGGPVWVEAMANEGDINSGGSLNDGVSSIIIGSNDWAAAWAVDEFGRPLAVAVPGDIRQRELAYRFGVNVVMYTLTGNYKADQVHVPALLERLGE